MHALNHARRFADPVKSFVISRGQNLISNGSGLLATSYNFSGFTFDPVETHGGGGSFKKNVANGAIYNDELIPVDIQRYYRLVIWGKAGDVGGGNFNAANVQYVGVSALDADVNTVDPHYYSKYAGSTDTTLAAQLNNGDATVSLTSSTGWYNGASATGRNFTWYPYTNAKGYVYPDYTYSRYASSNYLDFSASGAWANGGISGTTITLRSNWPGPTLAAGTKVRNSEDGGTFKYIGVSAAAVPNAWTRYEGYIGDIDTAGAQLTNKFPYGTQFLKLIFLINYHGAADNNIRWSDVWFSEHEPVILDEGTLVVPRGTLNFTGAGVSGADNSGNQRTDVTIP